MIRATGDGLFDSLAEIVSGKAQQLLCNSDRGVACGRITLTISSHTISLPCIMLTLPGPASFTGEDTVEIEAPGNPFLLDRIEHAVIDSVISQGGYARTANPGEFTARAFFGGRIGLLEAEGVAGLIAARNDEELLAAERLHTSPLAVTSTALALELTHVLGMVEAGIDFTDEEGVVAMSNEDIESSIRTIRDRLDSELFNRSGTEAPQGLPTVALVGPPNAGKSTLFNALIGHSRMIVSPEAGTTRDAPAETCSLVSRDVLLFDTAGIDGEASSEYTDIEKKMYASTQRAARNADLVLQCLPWTTEDEHSEISQNTDRVLHVATKVDLSSSHSVPPSLCGVSGVTGEGLDALRLRIEQCLENTSSVNADVAFRLQPRHKSTLDDARQGLSSALDLLSSSDRKSAPSHPEMLAELLRSALDALASLDGGSDTEEILGVVFSNFCVGK